MSFRQKLSALVFLFSMPFLASQKVTFPVRSLVTVEEKPVPIETEWSEKWFGKNPATVYNHSIARLAGIFSAVSYQDNDTDMDTNLLRQCYRALGIPQELIEMHYDIDYNDPVLGNDQAAFSFASRKIQSATGIKDLVFVVIRGTPLSANEWLSNINISDTTQTDTGFHEGFLKATETVKNRLIAYLFKHRVELKDCYLLITGHSRGAAVANLLAMQLGDSMLFSADNIYAYTFASPNVTTDSDADNQRYGYIWNIVNAEDIVPSMPPNYKEWRYTKYGHTLSIVNAWNTDSDKYEKSSLSSMNIYFRKFMHRDYSPFRTGPFIPIQVDIILTGMNKDIHSFYNGIQSLHSMAETALWKVFPPGTEGIEENDKSAKQGIIFSALTKWCYKSFGLEIDYVLNCFKDMHAMETYLSWIMSADEDELYSDIGVNLLFFKGSGDYAVFDSNGEAAATILDGKAEFSKIKAPVAANSLFQNQTSVGIPANSSFKIVASKESIIPTRIKVSVQHFDASGVYLGETKAVNIYPYNGRIYECASTGQSLDLNTLNFTKTTGKDAAFTRKSGGLENKTSLKMNWELSFSTSGAVNAGFHSGTNILYGTALFGYNNAKAGRSLELAPGIGHQSILVGRILLDTEIFASVFYALSDNIDEGDDRLNLVPSARFSLSFKPRHKIQLFASINLDLHISGFNDTAFDSSYRIKATSQAETGSSRLHTVPNLSFGIKF